MNDLQIISQDDIYRKNLNSEERPEFNILNYNNGRWRCMSFSQFGDSKSQSELHHDDSHVMGQSRIDHFQLNTPKAWNSKFLQNQDKSFINNSMMNFEQPMQINLTHGMRNPSISSIENKGSGKNSIFEGNDESSLILK